MEPLVVIVLIAVLSLVGLVALVAPRRRRRGAPPVAGRGPGAGPLTGAGAPDESAPGGVDVLDRPRGPVVEHPVEAPPAPGVVEPDLTAPGLDVLERPAPAAGRLQRLRARLARSQTTLGRGLLALLSRETLDEQTWEEVEDTLLTSDLGVGPSAELVDRLRTRVRVERLTSPEALRAALRDELLGLVDPAMDRSLATRRVDGRPAVVLVVGVNGTGKTTTVGKLARLLVAEDEDVLLGAADTFRAAAADQLQTWGDRVGVPVVRADRDGADPAAVAFEAVRIGTEAEVDCVVVDTAGRLQTKVGLMDELGKVKRVIERQAPVSEVLLVLDATTGQNGLRQAAVFAEVVDVTGIVLTKLDGTAKGGIVVAVQRQLGVPVKLVGLGEGPDDLAPFDPAAFVDGLLD